MRKGTVTMLNRIFGRLLVNAVVGLIVFALEPVPIIGIAAQILSFAL
jgi:hypothetical protein